ncbi:MAG: EAL domain-containing protein [Proteobacteria bacterium]|nr:EAL domain-containing protein [Pseudomonadota bacterium]
MTNIDDIIIYSQKLKLLYVEDNHQARESTLLILEEFFGDIVVAVNGDEGLNKFSEHDFDMVITDINMPKMNGLDMVDHIKKINDDIPILVFSAYNESGFFIESIKLGVDGYLLKPIDINQFIGLLGKVIEKIKLKTEAQKSESLLQQYKQLTDKSAIICIVDNDKTITYVNDAACQIAEKSIDELIGSQCNVISQDFISEDVYNDIWSTIKDKKQIWQGITKYISNSGRSYYLKNTIKPILDIDGHIIEYMSLRSDITEIMNPRRLLSDKISYEKSPLLVYLKLEDYNILEEFYDAQTVELIQDKVAQYIESNVPTACYLDKIYQLGQGEYAFSNEKSICMQNEQEFLSYLKDFQKIINKDVIQLDKIEYDISIIMSVAYDDSQVLESARLGIKKCIQNKYNFIVSSHLAEQEQAQAQKNIQTISMIKKAINEHKIVSFFQPIINNTTKEIEKYESLVRLIDENDKVLSPYHFLEISKKGKYYSQITAMVLDNSFKALNHTTMDISINLSVLDIEKPSTREKIFQYLEANKQNASRVVIELLEDESAKDFKTITSFISQVKKLGVQIAIDDFGAGYSNYERLLDYQPDILKIDGSLVSNIVNNAYSLSIVASIVSFAQQNNIKTIAEFVENEAIYEVLKNLDVDYSQGYYFGKPDVLSY